MSEDRPTVRLSAASQALVDPLDAALDAAVARGAWRDLLAQAEHPGALPYQERFRPVVVAQLNPALRHHPDWPAEWYVHVPTTRVTCYRSTAARLGQGRAEIRAFPTVDAAEAFAQDTWRTTWGTRLKSFPAESVISPTVVEEFTARWGRDADRQHWEAYQAAHPAFNGRLLLRCRDVPAVELGREPGISFIDSDTLIRSTQLLTEESDALWRARGSFIATLAAQDPKAPPPQRADAAATPDDPAAKRPPAPRPRPWEHPAGRHFQDVTRHLVAGLEAVPLTDGGYVKRAVAAAVRAVYDPQADDPQIVHPAAFRREIGRVLRAVHEFVPRGQVDLLAHQWAEAGEALTIEDVRLFVHGTTPVAIRDRLDHDEGASLLERTGYAHRMPNGSFVLWQATPESERAASVDRPLEPRNTSKALFSSWTAAQEAASALGWPLLVRQDHPKVPIVWAKTVAKYTADEAARRVTTAAFTPKVYQPTPDQRPARAPSPAPIPVAEALRVHVSPFGSRHAVWWHETPKGPALGAGPDTDGSPVVAMPRGFAAALAEARVVDPAVTPADLPRPLVGPLVQHGVFPTGPVAPRDQLWHVSDLPFAGQAVAWSRTWTPEMVRRLADHPRAEPPARPLTRADARNPLAAPRLITASQGPVLCDRLDSAGAVAVEAGRVLPASVAQAWANTRPGAQALLRGPQPEPAFDRLGRLPTPAQRALVDALPKPLQPAAWAAAHGLAPRDVAPLWGEPLDQIQRQFRSAERALGQALTPPPPHRRAAL